MYSSLSDTNLWGSLFIWYNNKQHDVNRICQIKFGLLLKCKASNQNIDLPFYGSNFLIAILFSSNFLIAFQQKMKDWRCWPCSKYVGPASPECNLKVWPFAICFHSTGGHGKLNVKKRYSKVIGIIMYTQNAMATGCGSSYYTFFILIYLYQWYKKRKS